MRYEIGVAFALFALYCLWKEVAGPRRITSTAAAAKVACGYFIPLLIACLAIGWFFGRGTLTVSQALAMFHDEQTATMGQWYAFGYQNRHPEWTRIPWENFNELCEKMFGDPNPTFANMLRRNPVELRSHVAWNYRLVPTGLQLSLFNCAAESVNPDLRLNKLNHPIAWLWTCLIFLIVALGARMWCVRSFSRARRFSERRLAWLVLIFTTASAPPILLTSPPRPEIFFCQTIVFMAVVGLAASAIVEGLERRGILQFSVPIALALILLLAPIEYRRPTTQTRPIRQAYRRLAPYESLIARAGAIPFGPAIVTALLQRV